MLKKILVRSLAGATAAGSVLAVSLVTTPGVVTSAPEIRPVSHCNSYAAGVPTTTSVSVKPAFGVYGTAARATVTVSASGGGSTPGGHVTIRLVRPGRDRVWSNLPIYGGSTTVGLPRSLAAKNTYPVRASYHPSKCHRWLGSSGSGSYTVFKVRTTTSVNAPNVKRGNYARVNVRVGSGTFTPVGKVRIAIERRSNGKVIATTTRTLSRGKASARFGKYRVGVYVAKVSYLGTNNFRTSSGSDRFRVYR